MKITPEVKQEVRRLRKEGVEFDDIIQRHNSYAEQVSRYCQELKDQKTFDPIIQLLEGDRETSDLDTYGIGMTLDEIRDEGIMNIQGVASYLNSYQFPKRKCLHCFTKMIPRGKFRLWCNERCYRAWKRTIKLWKERER